MRKAQRKHPALGMQRTQENKDSCSMYRLTHEEWEELAAENNLQLGNFCWGTTVVHVDGVEHKCRHLRHVLPSGDWGTIQIEPVPEPIKERIKHGNPPRAHTWIWDGNEDKPTLQPSVWLKGRWHGYFRAGRMESC